MHRVVLADMHRIVARTPLTVRPKGDKEWQYGIMSACA